MRLRVIISSFSTSILLIAGLAGGVADAAPSTIYVSKSHCSNAGPGTQASPYCTVQEGLSAVAAGGIVNVANGTYAEQITLNISNVTLKGSGNNTVIQEPSSNTAGGKIVDIQSTGSTIEDLSVSGPFNVPSCSQTMYGVYFENGSNATILNSKVTNIEQVNASLIGCQQGVGIRVGSQALGITAKATITNDTVNNYAKGGIVVDGTGSSATITDNNVTGFGPTSQTATNGIQISRGATATVSQNNIKGNEYTGSSATAAGILFYQAGKVDVTQNTANKNDVGFDVDTQNSSFVQNTANNNTANGFYVEPTSSQDSFIQNSAHNNSGTVYFTPPYDMQDTSTGSGTLGTANTWIQNSCKTSSPAQLCKQ